MVARDWRGTSSSRVQSPTVAPLILCGCDFAEHSADRVAFVAAEVSSKVRREERVSLRAGDGLLDVLLVAGVMAFQADQGGRELHLRVGAAKADGFLNPGVAVEAARRIGVDNRLPTS